MPDIGAGIMNVGGLKASALILQLAYVARNVAFPALFLRALFPVRGQSASPRRTLRVPTTSEFYSRGKCIPDEN